MLDEKKIRLMTRLAIYEQNEGKKELPTSKYYRTDYLALKMINSAIVMSLGYILLLGTIAFINLEELLSELVKMDLPALGRNILIIYAVLFVINMAATYFIESYRFKKARTNLNEYNVLLKELYAMYRNAENSNENRFFEEDFDFENIGMDNEKNGPADFGGINDDEAIDD